MKYHHYGVTKNKPDLGRYIGAVVASLGLAGGVVATAFAVTTQYVVPGNTDWSTADTRATGTVNIVADATTPFGQGALQLKTGDNVAGADGKMQDKAQYLHAAQTKLADVTALSYWTKQVSAEFAAGLPSYQIIVDTDGTVDGVNWTTLVYEPYNDQGNAAVHPNEWQSWNVMASTKLWSSKTVAAENANGGLVAGAGGAPFYSIADVVAKYPNAVAYGFGVNVGSNNPNWDTRVDGLNFNNTLYDFELTAPDLTPTVVTKDQCKNNGWTKVFTANDKPFTNQGSCVAYVQANEHASFKRER